MARSARLPRTDPTLTFNTIHRHQSMLVRTRVASNKSPWLSECNVDDEHLIAISHGEGRFVCNDGLLQQLINNGQVATQYVDLNCVPTMDMRYQPQRPCWPLRALPARTAACSARWAILSAAATACTKKRYRRQVPADF